MSTDAIYDRTAGQAAAQGVRASHWGTMSGALVLTLIDSLLYAAGLEQAYQWVMLSVILLLLIAVSGRLRRPPS